MRAQIPLILVFFILRSSPAQDLMSGSYEGGKPILFNGDTVVLESGDARKDLDCTVNSAKASLGFDMRFHSGYQVAIPMKELEGSGNALSIVFRVVSKNGTEPVYFQQQIRVPPIVEPDGSVHLEGAFDLGEGAYHVDWLMRDYSGRYCASSWDVDAALAPKDKQVTVALPPQSIRRMEEEKFQAEPPVQRASADAPLNVKVLMNFAPPRQNSAAIDAVDTTALVSILRSLSRNPKIGKFSLVAFNIQDQHVYYHQDAADHIDFPAMGRALKKLNLGTVNLNQLEHKHGDTEFLSSLVKKETTDEANPDGLIFVGPKALIEASVPQDDLKQIGELEYPVFYMNYSPDPQAIPWRDAIGRMVKFFKGREYTITGPRDLWNAVTEVVSRISKSKQTRETGALPAGQLR